MMEHMSGVLTPTPADGKAASDAVFTANNALLDDLKFDKRTRFQKLIALSDAERTFVTKAGAVIKAPDHFIQLNALKELCKLAGDYPAEKMDVTGNVTELARFVEALEKANAITAKLTGTEKPED
jgi:hypothetical protein